MKVTVQRVSFWIAVLTFAALVNALDFWGGTTVLCAMTSATAASWVQAIGSIAAIAAGAFGIAWQARQQHQSAVALDLRQRKLQTARSLAPVIQTFVVAGMSLRNFESWRDGKLHVDFFAQPGAEVFMKGQLESVANAAKLDHALIEVHRLSQIIWGNFTLAVLNMQVMRTALNAGDNLATAKAEMNKFDRPKMDEVEAAIERLKQLALTTDEDEQIVQGRQYLGY